MKVCVNAAILAVVGMVLPQMAWAQGFAGQVKGMQEVLQVLYQEMVAGPILSGMMNIGRSIAGFASIFYIGSRVWRHIANAEPIDFYPLLRPFAIGLAILFFSRCYICNQCGAQSYSYGNSGNG